MEFLYRLVFFASVSMQLLGCTDDDPAWSSRCALGESEPCDEGGERGRRWCTLEGDFGACTVRVDGTSERSPRATDPSDPTRIAGTGGTDGGRGEGPVVLGTCASHALPLRVVDAEYAASLDRVVAVGAAPSVLTLYDPSTREARTVDLPATPKAVSVAPDGRTAAVAHDAYVSIVDLEAATLQATIPTSCDAVDIVHGGNGYAYVFPASGSDDPVHSVEIATRTDRASTGGYSPRRGTHGRLHPNGGTLYSMSSQSSWDMVRYDVRNQPVATAPGSSYVPSQFDQALACSGLWFTETGDRMFTACGGVFRSPANTVTAFEYAGKLGVSSQNYGRSYRWVTHSAATKRIYAVPAGDASAYGSIDATSSLAETQVRTFSDDFLQLEPSLDVPCLDSKAGKQRVYGRFVFVDPTGKRLYVLGQLAAESGAANDWASAVIPL